MNCPPAWIGFLSGALMFGGDGLAADPTVDPKELPRIPPVEAKDALSTFKIKTGFRLELVAAEPLVVDPIALSFDESGRMFVVEMRDYSERRNERLGRIRMLEDTNGDGRFDQSTIYADDLPWPTAVICSQGGVFVGCTPDIFYFKDTNGDGKADVREVAFTGFAAGVERLNVQAMLNSFHWGLDNRIHGATSMSGGKVTSPKHPEAKPVELRGRDFSFAPRTLTMTSEAGGGQHGLSFDNWGRRFACNNSDHIRLFMYDDHYAARNPYYAMPSPLVSIAADGPAAEVYRISPNEPWRIVRTRWRVAGAVSGPVEGGGRVSGYFTGATGTTIYRGKAYPEDFQENAFIGDAGGNLVHRKKLHPDGVGLIARRPEDEQKVEFLASKDIWFRPVQFANAPDGTLYIADMYREVIEHPWSLPESIKKHLDLNSGHDRGRIYRIVPDNFKQPKRPQLGKASTKELVATLAHPNGWHRDTAARLLYERQDKAAVPALERLLEKSNEPLGRLHALYALDSLSALALNHVIKALDDSAAGVREHGVRLSEEFLSAEAVMTAALEKKLLSLASDPSPRVRYQLAFTLGEVKHPAKVQTLAEIIRRDPGSKWIQAAVLSSLADGAAEMFVGLAADPVVCDAADGQEFLRQLLGVVGTKNSAAEVAQVLDFIEAKATATSVFLWVRALGDGLQRAGSSLARADAQGKLKPILSRARALLTDDKAAESTRSQAVELLGLSSYAEVGDGLVSLFYPNQSEAVQLAAIRTLARFTDPKTASALVQRWTLLTPRLRSEALVALLARPERVEALLGAIEQRTILPSELSSTQIKFLQSHRDQKLRERAAKLFGHKPSSERQNVMDTLLPALGLKGMPAKGQEVYLARCASCHRLAGQGYALGPDMASVKSSGKETMLLNILDPNREVQPSYLSYIVETKDGESLIGLIGSETPTSVTLRQANGVESVVLRSTIQSIKSQGQSIMPDGLEAGLTPQEIADLLEYIATAEEPKK